MVTQLMFDATLRPFVDKILDPAGLWFYKRGISANHITILGLIFGLLASVALIFDFNKIAFALIVLNRLFDGLDGAVARAGDATDFGGYLDIVCDFVFYGAIPTAFAISNPENAIAAAFLLFSFIGTSSSFLAYAIFAEKHGISTNIRGQKSFFYLGGLTEGTETIAILLAMVIWPHHFVYLAWGYGSLCWVTAATRITAAFQQFGQRNS